MDSIMNLKNWEEKRKAEREREREEEREGGREGGREEMVIW